MGHFGSPPPASFRVKYWVIFLPSGTSAASMTSVSSKASTAWFHQKNLLSLMFLLTLAPKWSMMVSQCEMDHQKHTIVWNFGTLSVCEMDHQKRNIVWNFGTLSVWGCGAHGCDFQPNPRVISQISPSHKYTIFMTQNCILIPNKCVCFTDIEFEHPVISSS